MKRKIKVVRDIPVFTKYRPLVGKIYDAVYSPAYAVNSNGKGEFCVIDVLDKKIILRAGEFEVVGT